VRGWLGGERAVGSVTPFIVLSTKTWGTSSERGGASSGLCLGKRVDNESDYRSSHERRATTASSMKFHNMVIDR